MSPADQEEKVLEKVSLGEIFQLHEWQAQQMSEHARVEYTT